MRPYLRRYSDVQKFRKRYEQPTHGGFQNLLLCIFLKQSPIYYHSRNQIFIKYIIKYQKILYLHKNNGRDVKSVCLKIKYNRGCSTEDLLKILADRKEHSDKCKSGEITIDTYDEWRYNYPKYYTKRIWEKVPSQDFSDAMVEAFKNKLKDM